MVQYTHSAGGVVVNDRGEVLVVEQPGQTPVLCQSGRWSARNKRQSTVRCHAPEVRTVEAGAYFCGRRGEGSFESRSHACQPSAASGTKGSQGSL